MADSPPTELATGRLLGGRYRLERRIAAGGMASVWEGVDEVLARQVALKLLHPHLAADDTFVTRFRREAVNAARLTHPSIVSIYDTVSDNGAEAIVMELVRGHTLRAELDRRGKFESGDAAAIVAQIADALDCAHTAGIVHRDMKPANVLLSADGRVLVADFGIAKAADGLDLTGTNTTLGTAKYLAPEQVEGAAVDARADVYALGVILYELVCGRVPFLADTEAATALARLHREPDDPRAFCPTLPAPIETVILKALARRPDDRFPTAASFRHAVLEAASGRGRPSTAPGWPRSTPPNPTPAVAPPDATMADRRDATKAAAAPSTAWAAPAAAPPRAPAPPPKPNRRRRSWLRIALLGGPVLVAIIVVAILALGTSGGGGNGGGASPASLPAGGGLAIATVHSFDPLGDDGGVENEAQVPNLIDGIASTTWSTSRYRGSPLFGGLKDGLGLVVELQDTATLDRLIVDGPSDGWSAQVYIADEPAATLAGWGTPVAEATDLAPGTNAFDLSGASGRFVLLWITELAPSGDRFNVQLTGLAVD